MGNQPSASLRVGAVAVGPQEHRRPQLDLAVVGDAHLHAVERHAVVDDAAAGLGHPVGGDHVGGPVGRRRLAADQDRAEERRVDAGERGGHERGERAAVVPRPASTAPASKPACTVSGRAGEQRPGDDGQPADVGERQAGQPAVGRRVDAEPLRWWRAADAATAVVGEHRRPWARRWCRWWRPRARRPARPARRARAAASTASRAGAGRRGSSGSTASPSSQARCSASTNAGSRRVEHHQPVRHGGSVGARSGETRRRHGRPRPTPSAAAAHRLARRGWPAPGPAPCPPRSCPCWWAPPARPARSTSSPGGRSRPASVALALQVGTNFANDYSDGVRGTDDPGLRVGPGAAVGLGHPAARRREAGGAAVASRVRRRSPGWPWPLAVGPELLVVGRGRDRGRLVLHGRLAPLRLLRLRRAVRVRVLRAGGHGRARPTCRPSSSPRWPLVAAVPGGPARHRAARDQQPARHPRRHRVGQAHPRRAPRRRRTRGPLRRRCSSLAFVVRARRGRRLRPGRRRRPRWSASCWPAARCSASLEGAAGPGPRSRCCGGHRPGAARHRRPPRRRALARRRSGRGSPARSGWTARWGSATSARVEACGEPGAEDGEEARRAARGGRRGRRRGRGRGWRWRRCRRPGAGPRAANLASSAPASTRTGIASRARRCQDGSWVPVPACSQARHAGRRRCSSSRSARNAASRGRPAKSGWASHASRNASSPSALDAGGRRQVLAGGAARSSASSMPAVPPSSTRPRTSSGLDRARCRQKRAPIE